MSKEKYKDEDLVKKFVEENEKGDKPSSDVELIEPEVLGSPLHDVSGASKPWEKEGQIKSELSSQNQIGLQKLNLEDFPTKGLFYPEGTEILIRAALSGEIRHWSTLDERDLSALDDMLNFILERCVTIKFPSAHASWKDLKEVDRFYVILAIHEYTFKKGENKLQVRISETKKLDVRKEMIDYITIDERIMKHYNSERRCFLIDLKDGSAPFEVSLPSVGVTNWLKNYVIRKSHMNEPIEKDFINFAPFVILDWKGLGDKVYEGYIMDAEQWSIKKISALAWLKDTFIEAVEPVVKYTEEQGGERQVPLNFQGGIKSIFLISDPLG
jgi:hypothetical protein